MWKHRKTDGKPPPPQSAEELEAASPASLYRILRGCLLGMGLALADAQAYRARAMAVLAAMIARAPEHPARLRRDSAINRGKR